MCRFLHQNLTKCMDRHKTNGATSMDDADCRLTLKCHSAYNKQEVPNIKKQMLKITAILTKNILYHFS